MFIYIINLEFVFKCNFRVFLTQYSKCATLVGTVCS